ncbi:hypothetical protein [Bradyrhizobium paxllaeri]|uniref:hypothetical protein n=1 Tax=Bradyrhizobium paxllaeri TaxID=190148 RepID=UPI000810864A|nr:hypothetical protein [Bradyrhizobium paxllaeri]
MTKLDARSIANMEFVLEETCRVFPNGGDHEQRRYIAQKLKLSARRGNITLEGLRAVALSALNEMTKQRSA